MNRTFARLLGALWLAIALSPLAHAQGLEPETGVFGNLGPPDPYTLTLRNALLGQDAYRQCQLLVAPSFEAEYAVYMVKASDGSATVVSRTLDRQLWGELMADIRRSSKSRSYSIGASAQQAALKRSKAPGVRTHRAVLDAESTERLGGICRDVLLQVRYPQQPSRGVDGVSYHAAHWEPGLVLSGATWSPEDDSLAGAFVAMELALKAYADAPATQREARRRDLSDRARQVSDRLQTLGR